MSQSFNTGLLQKKRSHGITLEYLLSTDMKIQMGSGMLLKRMLLPSNGTSQNLQAKLSSMFSELGRVLLRKRLILRSLEEVKK